MSEKRFVIDEEGISDNKTDKWYCWKEEVVDLLNEQQSIIHRDEISIKTMMSNMGKLEKENEKLSKQLEDCKDYNAILYRNCMQKDKRWLKRVEKLDEELEEYIKENARLREMHIND